MSHARSEVGLRGIRGGPSAWLGLVLVSLGLVFGEPSGFIGLVFWWLLFCLVELVALLRGLILVRLALLGAWSSSRSLLGSRFGATSWPHLGRWFFGEVTHRVGKDRRLVSPAHGPEREGIHRSSERIVARGDWIQLAHAGARSEQLEDHTRWKGPRQSLGFSSSVPPS